MRVYLEPHFDPNFATSSMAGTTGTFHKKGIYLAGYVPNLATLSRCHHASCSYHVVSHDSGFGTRLNVHSDLHGERRAGAVTGVAKQKRFC